MADVWTAMAGEDAGIMIPTQDMCVKSRVASKSERKYVGQLLRYHITGKYHVAPNAMQCDRTIFVVTPPPK